MSTFFAPEVLSKSSNEGPTVRRPCGPADLGAICGEQFFIGAVSIGDHQIAFSFLEFLADKGNMLTVWRKGDVGIDVVYHAFGVTAENRCAVKAADIFLRFFGAHKIDVVAVG